MSDYQPSEQHEALTVLGLQDVQEIRHSLTHDLLAVVLPADQATRLLALVEHLREEAMRAADPEHAEWLRLLTAADLP